MTAAVAPKRSTTSTGAVPPAARAGAPRRRGWAQRLRDNAGTTPGRYRLWSLALAAVLLMAVTAAVLSATQMRSATASVDANSGPVLVATQQLISSMAEADAAATAAFLSGRNEDPEQRRLYESALARAGQQLERIAALAGDDPDVHDTVQRISIDVTRYAGLVEAARASNRAGVVEATGYLEDAVRLVDQIVQGDVKRLTEITETRLDRDVDERGSGFLVAILGFVATVVVLAFAQVMMTKSSRRIINLPLALATALVLIALAALVRADRGSDQALTDARQNGYDSVALTVRLASAGFGSKAAETLALITGDQAQREAADTQAQAVAGAPVTDEVADQIRRGTASGSPGGLIAAAAARAENPRERAAVAEAGLRWQRYDDTAAALRAATTPAAAIELAVGEASSDFNGFNFAVESLLGQNRGQFLSGLSTAATRAQGAPLTVLLLLSGALLAALWGFQLRINEYR